MSIGGFGNLRTVEIGPKRYEARARFRDVDGRTKQIRAIGTTKGAAERELKDRINKRVQTSTLSRGSRVSDLLDAWLVEVYEAAELAAGSKRLYRMYAEKHVRPVLGNLYLSEVTVPAIDRCLRDVRAGSGRGAAKTTRSVLSGVFGVAVRTGLLPSNPARDAISLPVGRKTATRAFTVEEEEDVRLTLRTVERAVEWDLPDLVDWMLYTACRIGEALAVAKPDLELHCGSDADDDPPRGTWAVSGTVVREPGRGLVRQEWAKTANSTGRVLALPPGAVRMLERRFGELRLEAPGGIVFGSPRARALRDPSNTSADLRAVLTHLRCANPDCDGAGKLGGRKGPCLGAGPYAWATSHTFRKTALTRLDEAGQTPRQVADQAGHAHASMTLDHYIGRKVVNSDAARILDR